MTKLIKAESDLHWLHARQLIEEYAHSLDFDLAFQGFGEEIADLTKHYFPPDGRLLLAQLGEAFVGCIALRKLENDICEMKRLYVKPSARGKGLGSTLVRALIMPIGRTVSNTNGTSVRFNRS